jgi:hypothetical protein
VNAGWRAGRLELEEFVEHFTLYPDETRLLRNKSGATRLGFGVSLKFLLWKARFPRGRSELPDNMIEFVAGQVGMPAADISFYDWDGRQVNHRTTQVTRRLPGTSWHEPYRYADLGTLASPSAGRAGE